MMNQQEDALVPILKQCVSSPQTIYHLLTVLDQTGTITLTIRKPIKIGNTTISPIDGQTLHLVLRRKAESTP